MPVAQCSQHFCGQKLRLSEVLIYVNIHPVFAGLARLYVSCSLHRQTLSLEPALSFNPNPTLSILTSVSGDELKEVHVQSQSLPIFKLAAEA